MKLSLRRKFEMSEHGLKEFIVWLTGNWYVRRSVGSLVWKLRRNRGKLNRFIPTFL